MTYAATTIALDTDMIIASANNARSTNNAARLKATGKNISPEKMDEVAQDFEAHFISQMLENMFSTIDTREGLGGSDSEEIYRSMMVDEYGKMITRAGGIGVADQIKREMLKLQEVSAKSF